MSTRRNLPRVVRAKTAPLTAQEAASAAPAILTRESGPNQMGGYAHICTEDIVNRFQELGFVITEASQERATAYSWQDAYSKHMVRMRHQDFWAPANRDTPPKLGEVVPEVVLVNSHNGSTALHLYAGLWRFICTNGLMAGTDVASIAVRHMGPDINSLIAKAAEDMGSTILPALGNQVMHMQGTKLTMDQQHQLAKKAIALRWGADSKQETTSLLVARRPADKGDDAWHVFNRLQENLMVGGFANSRNRTVSRLENVSRVLDLNRGLWDVTMQAVLAANPV